MKDNEYTCSGNCSECHSECDHVGEPEKQQGCSGDCSSCSSNCGGGEPADMHAELNANSTVKHVIAVVSGKGGVGKSMVTSMLAVTMNRRGMKTAILDADMTGPSIPKCFGVTERAKACEYGILPAETEKGIKLTSINLFLDNEDDPVIWRGVIIGNTVKQFWTDVYWGDVDYMFIDMPPGTGDVPLTVFQSLAVDGIIVVTSPQELVSMIVGKAVKMAEMMNIPILGIVENMSWFECPDCGKKHEIFGTSKLGEVAAKYGIPVLARLPMRPDAAAAIDAGAAESLTFPELDELADKL